MRRWFEMATRWTYRAKYLRTGSGPPASGGWTYTTHSNACTLSVMVVRQEGANVNFVSVITFGEKAAVAEQVATRNSDEQVVTLNDGLILRCTEAGVTLTDGSGRLIDSAVMSGR